MVVSLLGHQLAVMILGSLPLDPSSFSNLLSFSSLQFLLRSAQTFVREN